MKRLVLAFALLGVASACERPKIVPYDEAVCAQVRARSVPDAGFLPYAHSHNDYQHERPLLDALDARFYSVEADIWLRSGQVAVSHDSYSSKGLLKELYLDPLQARVDAQGGSVHGDGVQFVLWLDLKDGSYGLRAELEKLLAQYPMFSVFTDDAESTGPVVAVLTGNDASKKVFVDESGTRRALRDSNNYSPSDPAADNRWRYYALDWPKYIAWDGVAEIPSEERKRLGCLVGDIHQKGKKVRFWAAPFTVEFNAEMIAAGVDFIGTDNPGALAQFLSEVPP